MKLSSEDIQALREMLKEDEDNVRYFRPEGASPIPDVHTYYVKRRDVIQRVLNACGCPAG